MAENGICVGVALERDLYIVFTGHGAFNVSLASRTVTHLGI